MFPLPRFELPALVAHFGQRLPQWPHSLALTGALNLAVKLKFLPAPTLAALENKYFRIQVKDAGSAAHFTYRNGLFRPLFRPEGEPDLAFSAKLSAYLQLLARQEDPDTLFFNRELDIAGDTELGLTVKNMLDALEWPGSGILRA